MKKTKLYKIIDLQGTGWWDYTHTQPLTQREIKWMFRRYAKDGGIILPTRNHYNLDFIQDLWECLIVEVEQ